MAAAVAVMRALRWGWACLAWLGLGGPAAATTGPCAIDLHVDAKQAEQRVRLDVRLLVPVPKSVAWEVMTDYDGATRFIRRLRHSQSQPWGPQQRLVQQVGWVGWGPFQVGVRTDYVVRFSPDRYEVVGELVRGDVRSMHMHAHLTGDAAEPTVLEYRLDTEPGPLIPDRWAASVMRQQAQDSFQDLASEMLRRAGVCPPLPTPVERGAV